MYPHFFHLPVFGIIVGPQTVMTVVAVVAGLALGPGLARRLEGIEPRRTRHAQLGLALVALYGGHLLWVFNQWSFIWARTKAVGPYDLLAPWQGLHAPGSLIALLLAGPWVLGRLGMPIGKFADVNAPLLGVCLFLVRIGCFLQGCCWGPRCDGFWCVSFAPGSAPYETQRVLRQIPYDAPGSLPLHPLQLYFAAAALVLVFGSIWLHRHKQYDGQVALAGLLWFAATSTGLEFLRQDFGFRVYVGPLPQLAWLGLLLCAVALGGLLAGHVLLRRREQGEVQAVGA